MGNELGRSVKEAVMPIVYSDGRVIRLENPALPTRDCLLEDAEHNGKVFKIWNRISDGGVLAAFNLDSEEHAVAGTLSAADIPGLNGERYVIYIYFAKTAAADGFWKRFDVTLRDYDDFRLLLFVPMKDGVAPIGLTEKYMVPVTCKQTGKHRWHVKDGGNFSIYSEHLLTGATVDGVSAAVEKTGENLYSICLKAAGEVSVAIR